MMPMVIVDSKTGNTRMVAEALAAAFDSEVCTVDAVDAAALAAADTVLFGFWTDKGTCSEAAQALLPQLAGKRVFLFGTAGFGGDPAYFERILANVRAALPEGARYLGGAMCQGKMGAAIKVRYEAQAAAHPDDERAQLMLRVYEQGLAHPDEGDLHAIVAAARAALA